MTFTDRPAPKPTDLCLSEGCGHTVYTLADGRMITVDGKRVPWTVTYAYCPRHCDEIRKRRTR